MRMKNALKKGALYSFTGAFIILYFMYPESVSRAVSGALSLSGGVVIPSLFIFFVINRPGRAQLLCHNGALGIVILP